MSFAIKTHQLSRRFGRLRAVDDLALEVPAGCIYGYLGPNGAGKTTTIKMLLNLIRPTSGHAQVLGAESGRLSPGDLAAIGYVSENQELPGWMRVDELLAYYRPLYRTWDQDLSDKLLSRFHLPPDQKIKHLSRGMKAKLALQCALSFRPRLLILDEPFSGLDPLVREELIQGVLELGGQEGWTVFLSSHDMNQVEMLADQVGFLSDGRLLFSDRLDNLLESHREIEVVVPQAVSLPQTLPQTWLSAETTDRAIRIVESAYDPHGADERLRAWFPEMTGFTTTPMSLQSIFISLARKYRQEVSP